MKNSRNNVFCSELWDKPVFTYDGNVIPCWAVSDYNNNFGNINDYSFYKIWNSKQYQDARSSFSKKKNNLTIDSNNICVKCKGKIKTGICSDINL
jgi:radical SAM protein with 4Fe4S-binding SPASM domain